MILIISLGKSLIIYIKEFPEIFSPVVCTD